MAKADLHCHSEFSDRPSEWFLQKLGAHECYTKPEALYGMANENGMDFVTITDHNRIEGSLILKEKFPEKAFTGCEVTTYFPENRCKIHFLVYGITQQQFDDIMGIRGDIYILRDFVAEQKIAYSIAHPTFAINNKLSIDHLEKLILMFDVFESLNGARSRMHNDTFESALKNLTPDHISRLYSKHGIEPISTDPWIKGFTGGSDDHAGLTIGKSYTEVKAKTVDEFLEQIRNKHSISHGRHNDFKGLAFSIYKIAYEFSKRKASRISKSMLNEITEVVFEKKEVSLLNQAKAALPQTILKNKRTAANKAIYELLQMFSGNKNMDIDRKYEIIYDKIASITDDLLSVMLSRFEKNIKKGDIFTIVNSISAALPGAFLSAPFFSTLFLLCRGRELTEYLEQSYIMKKTRRKKRVLWFTDTMTDLNGVCTTLSKIGWMAYQKGHDIRIATSFNGQEDKSSLPPNIMELPQIYEYGLPYYEMYKMRFPSILNSLKLVWDYNPDEIYISTPGPVGLFGILAAKILSVKCVGIYHTDFLSQADEIVGNESLSRFIADADRWFYSIVDEIQVPTTEYFTLLEDRGLDRSKMKLFKKGIDSRLFMPSPAGKTVLQRHYNVNGGINLLYCGRISRDKNLDFMLGVYRQLREKYKDLNLILVGDGPYQQELKDKTANEPDIIFTGQVKYEMMPEIYSGADLFLFPSTTDTFGNVVLEAQSSGCPAVVSNVGGPQEIVIEGETGFVLNVRRLSDWTEKLDELITMIRERPEEFRKLKVASRENAKKNFDWNVTLQEITTFAEVVQTQKIAAE